MALFENTISARLAISMVAGAAKVLEILTFELALYDILENDHMPILQSMLTHNNRLRPET